MAEPRLRHGERPVPGERCHRCVGRNRAEPAGRPHLVEQDQRRVLRGGSRRRQTSVEEPCRLECTEVRRRHVEAGDIDDQMSGRIGVDAHRTTSTDLRRHRIRHRRPRRKVDVRRIRTRRPTRIHRRETTTETPRRRDIQRHRSRSGRHTTTTRNRHCRRRTSTRNRRQTRVEKPRRLDRTEVRRRHVEARDIDDQMSGRIGVDAHRTTSTDLRRHRIRHRRPRRKVDVRRIRTRRPTRIHRRETATETPRRRDIQRHRSRSGRHTTTTRNRQLPSSTPAPGIGDRRVSRSRAGSIAPKFDVGT